MRFEGVRRTAYTKVSASFPALISFSFHVAFPTLDEAAAALAGATRGAGATAGAGTLTGAGVAA